MSIDGLTLRAVVDELQVKLVGGKVQKSQQPKKDEIILNIYNNKQNFKLLINCNAEKYRIHITKHPSTNPKQAPLFCMLLRKHIDNGKIIKIEQPDLERVVKIYISSRDELGNPVEKVLICELMGKHSNLILANANTNKIIDAVKRVSFGVSSVRQILPGFSYISPPLDKKSILNSVTLSDNNLANALVDTFAGISPLIAREMDYRYNSFNQVQNYIIDLIENQNYQPSITKSKHGNMWCGVIPYTHLSKMHESFSSMNEALDEYNHTMTVIKQFNSYKQDLIKICNKTLSKNNRTLKKQIIDLNSAQKAEKYKRTADLIKANLYQIKEGIDQVEVIDYFDPEMPTVIIKLDPHKSPNNNLTNLYKKYEKAERTKENLSKRIKNNKLEIDYLESIIALINTSLNITDLEQIKYELIEEGFINPPKQKKNKHKKNDKEVKLSQPRKYMSKDGFIIEVGKNNRQNDNLTLKKAHKEDIWLHTKDIPGAHVVIRNKGEKVSDDTLIQAANLAAFFSKAGGSANVPVDYTTIKRVFKQRGAHPGQVLYTHQRTVFVTPDSTKFPEEIL